MLAELAVINAVQRSLASRLDIQGVYEAVGDKLCEVFPRKNVSIRIRDEDALQELLRYTYYAGKRRRTTEGHHGPSRAPTPSQLESSLRDRTATPHTINKCQRRRDQLRFDDE